MAICDDKMQALAVMQQHLGRRSDGASNSCTPSILKKLDKKTRNLVSDRHLLLYQIKLYDASNCQLSLQVDARSKLKSIEKKIYRCHALKYIVQNVDTWQLLLMPGRTNENERRALNRMMEKYNKVKDPIWRSDRYIVLQTKIRQLIHNINMYLHNHRALWCFRLENNIRDPQLETWHGELDQYHAEISDLRVEHRMAQVLDQKDDLLWEKALMWVCHWKCVPSTIKTWIIEYEKLRNEFWGFWKYDKLHYGTYFSDKKHTHRNIDTFPSETTLASYFRQPEQSVHREYRELSIAQIMELTEFFLSIDKKQNPFHNDVCQKTYYELYGRKFDDFRSYQSDTDSNPDSEHHSISDSESHAPSSKVSSEWEEETDSDTEQNSLAKQHALDP